MGAEEAHNQAELRSVKADLRARVLDGDAAK